VAAPGVLKPIELTYARDLPLRQAAVILIASSTPAAVAASGWLNDKAQLMVEMVQAALREVDLSPEQALAFKAALARQARELTAPP
jgi:hypothetical protein